MDDASSTSLEASFGRAISSLPHTISLPGRHYVTTNLRGVAGQSGITIAASGVTLDLMGFELVGVADSLDGVSVSVTATNIDIHNGTVRNWGRHGIFAEAADNSLFHDLRMSANGWHGLLCGPSSRVSNCTASRNVVDGIRTRSGCTVDNCMAYGNVNGIACDESIVIVDCTTSSNVGDGINVATGTISGCSASDNGADGIFTYLGSTITACTATGNAHSDIVVGEDPIFTPGSGLISGCTASFHDRDGIEVGNSCLVVENTCMDNGLGSGAGIRTHGSGNRVDSNNVVGNHRGLWIQGTSNLIIRNSTSDNVLNYDISSGNRYGAIVNVTGPGAPAVSGNDAVSTLPTTDPWANFAY